MPAEPENKSAVSFETAPGSGRPGREARGETARLGGGSLRPRGRRAHAGRARADDRRAAGCSARPDLCQGHSRGGLAAFSTARWSTAFFATTPSIRRWAAGCWESPRRSASRSRCSGRGRTRPGQYVLAGRLAPAVCFAVLVAIVTLRGRPPLGPRRRGRGRLRAAGDAARLRPRPPGGARHVPELVLDARAARRRARASVAAALSARWPPPARSGRWPS